MTSNVIINFGANASQAFKAMNAVKAEMKTLQKQAVVTSKATSIAASGPSAFKRNLSDLRFGMGMITGFIGINIFREVFAPIKEGFTEITSRSTEFVRAINLVRDGLVDAGREAGKFAIPLGSMITDAVAWIVEKTQGRLAAIVFKAGMVDREISRGLFGSEFTSSVADYEKWQAKQLDIAKRQLAYVKDTATTLRRMENDLDRMNMVDPW